MTSDRKSEKLELEYVEDVKDLEADDPKAQPQGDYSGFTQKTDPVEIKLVRKLDCFIMVSVGRCTVYSVDNSSVLSFLPRTVQY